VFRELGLDDVPVAAIARGRIAMPARALFHAGARAFMVDPNKPGAFISATAA
jgi:hypothetical protein